MDKIQDIAQKFSFKKSQIIFQEGDRADGLYMVATGKIKVFKLSAEGKEQILHIYGPGNTFGEVPVFEGKHFPATSMALEKSEVIFLPRNRFVELISTTPALSMNMLADLSRRLRGFTIQVENLSLKEVPARLAAYIITLAEEQDNEDTVELPISKAQLANLIGTTPETISRMLKKMGTKALIRTQGKNIQIMNMDRLCELSESGRL